MKKDKLFDVIVYRFLLSIPLSCVANFIYGCTLFFVLWIWSDLNNSFEHILVFLSAIVPFILFNMTRYLAIKSGHIQYGLTELFLSSIPEYLFITIILVYL